MKKLMLLLSLAAIGFSCAKKDNNTPQAVGYQLSANGSCVDQTNGQIVQPQLCQNAGSNGYSCVLATNRQPVSSQLCATNSQYQQYICISTTSGQQVTNQLCLNGGGIGGAGYPQQCNGYYLYCAGGTQNCQQVQCGMDNTGRNVCSNNQYIYMQQGQQIIQVQCL